MQRTDSLEKTLMLGKMEVRGKGDNRGWDGWKASPTQWTWVWVSSRSWWWTGRPDVLQSMGSQRVGHDWATELNWTELTYLKISVKITSKCKSQRGTSLSFYFPRLPLISCMVSLTLAERKSGLGSPLVLLCTIIEKTQIADICWIIRKDPDAGKDWRQEEKGMTEDELVGRHHQLNGHEFG